MGTSIREEITNYQRDLLKSERQRTTVSPQELLKGSAHDAPTGLNASLISAWITGKIKTARPDHLQWVINKYKHISAPEPLHPITDKMRKALDHEFLRTGIGSIRLLSGSSRQIPHGLNASMINSWRSETAKMARDEHWTFVMSEYALISDKSGIKRSGTKKRNKSDRIILTDSHLALLESEKDRTGLGTINIMRHLPSPLPDGLTRNVIQSWNLRTTKSAKVAHWECIMNAYKTLPDIK